MVFDPTTASHLKPWLVRTLEPICDAEPGALADYILALLKHNVPEGDMRKELAVQLEEFLEKECSSFIDTLFTVLRTKSYLPYAASPSSPYSSTNSKSLDTGIPIPLDGLLSPSLPTSPDRNRKRSIDNDERDGRPPAKGPRLSTEGQFSRYSNGRGSGQDARSTGGWGAPLNGHGDNGADMNMGGIGNMGTVAGMGNMGVLNGSMVHSNGRRPQAYQPPDQKRGICRDYHNSGYCGRGAFCKYSHGEDAVVPGQLFPMNGPTIPGTGMPFMSMFPNGGVPFAMGGGAYDPHESRMDMRPLGPGGMGNGAVRPQVRAPLLPRIQREDGSRVVHPVHASGELPVIQDLTPSLPPDGPQLPHPESQPQPSQSKLPSQSQLPMQLRGDNSEGFRPDEPGGFSSRAVHPMNGPSLMPMDGSRDVEMGPPMQVLPIMNNQTGGFHGGMHGGGRGRSAFGGEVHNFRPERRNDKTLVVEKIPENKLSLEHVNDWFKRFGTVTNVAIDASNAKALVSFSNHDEAHAAWKSQDAVFNNRFVKLFWHRPMEGHGQVGARMLAASGPLVANITTTPTSTPPAASVSPSVTITPSSAPQRKTTTSSTATALAAKHQLLEQQIAEQKSLMASLATASPDEKKNLMIRLRKLGEEMKPLSPASIPATGTKLPPSSATRVDEHERKEKERLDKELEMHTATLAAEGERETTEDLKAKLERLKAEAASLGLTEVAHEPPHSGGYRPYRGRGRGARANYYRGTTRGGPPRGSMKLDNRPKKLLVKGVGNENVQALRDWYETTGQMESLDITDNGEAIVTFRTRGAAEQGLAKGTHVPTVGPIQITWFTGQPSNAPSVSVAKSPVTRSFDATESKSTAQERSPSPEIELRHSPQIPEEEVVASGWGGDGDGEDGMGML